LFGAATGNAPKKQKKQDRIAHKFFLKS